MIVRYQWCVRVAAVLSLSAPWHSGAQVSAAPACDALARRAERLECRFQATSDEGLATARALAQPPFSDGLSPSQRRALSAAEDRLVRERGRIRGADLEGLARGKRVRCAPRECDFEVFPNECRVGDGDGICEDGEDCLEAVGDGVGDDVQPCFPTKGAGREVCAEICSDAAAALDDRNFDDGAVEELESAYDDLLRGAREVNETLPAAAAAFRAGPIAGAATADPCARAMAMKRYSYAVYHSARMSATSVRAAADVAERFCDGAIAGASKSALCVVAETLAGVPAMWWTFVDLSESALDAMALDATLECASKVREKASDVAARIDAAVRRAQGVEETEAYILRLVETAQGRRPDFPVED